MLDFANLRNKKQKCLQSPTGINQITAANEMWKCDYLNLIKTSPNVTYLQYCIEIGRFVLVTPSMTNPCRINQNINVDKYL